VAGGSAVRNRSEIVTVVTRRSHVEVARQELRGLRRASGWTCFWVARRQGRGEWCDASTSREANGRAALFAPRKPPAWLGAAAVLTVERQIMTAPEPPSREL
jgi:hypothetical protein